MVCAGLSLVFWGLWGVFGKLASSGGMPAKTIFVIETVVALLVAVAWLAFSGFRVELHSKAVVWAVLTGLTLGLGQLFFFLALSRGKVSLVIGLTSLYPLITIGLAFLFLKEQVSWTQGLGIALAAMAVPLLAF